MNYLIKNNLPENLSSKNDVSKTNENIINEFIGDFRAKSTLIDCSTIDVKTTKEVCKTLNKKDISMLDAPVSGGVKGAKSGNLTFMVGGNNEVFEKFNLFHYIANRFFFRTKLWLPINLM